MNFKKLIPSEQDMWLIAAVVGIVATETFYGTRAADVRVLMLFVNIPLGFILGIIFWYFLKSLWFYAKIGVYIAMWCGVIFVIYMILDFLYNTVLWTNPV